MRPRQIAATLLVPFTLAIAASLAEAPAAHAAKPFKAYPSCGSKGKHGDSFCLQGDRPIAVLRAFGRAEVAYRLCTRKAGAKRRCSDRRTRRPGQRSRTRFDVDGPGKYKLAWFVDGRSVDRDSLYVRDRSLLLVGDSLSEGTRPYLPRALRGWSVAQDVSTSRHVPEGVSILRRRGSLPSVTVFALGTNDDPGAVGSFIGGVETALGLAGSTRCVVVPNIVRPPVGGRSYAGYNSALAALARRRENLRVADWAGLVARNRGWLAADGSHVNATGYWARARLIARQAERC